MAAKKNSKYSGEELRDMSQAELLEQLTEDQQKLNQTKFNHHVTPMENPNLLKQMRKNIARIKTELRARELAEKK